MSKRTRTLLISAIALVALGALLAVLLLLPDVGDGGGATTTTTANDPTVVLVDKAKDVTVSSVTVKLENETFTVAANKDGDLAVQGYEDLPQYPTAYESLADALLSFGAYRLIQDNPAHPEDFGFDTDKGGFASLEVTYSDNTTFAFELGDLSPSGEGYYLRKADSSAVYLIDTDFVYTVAADSTYYLSTTPFTAPSATESNEEVVVRDVTLTGSVRPSTLSFQISTDVVEKGQQAQVLSGFYVTKPYLRNLKSGTNMLSSSSYYGFAASGIAKVRPTAADLAKYGLNDPYSACVANVSVKKTTETTDKDTGEKTTTISFHNTFEYTVKLGKETENGDRYAVAYMDGEMVPLLYTVTPSSLVWAETQYDDIADELLFFTYIYQVEKMDITMDGKTTSFDLTHNAEAEERDDQLTVISNGKQYPTADFRTLYTELMQITRKEALAAKPTGEPLLSIDIVTNTSIAHTGWIKLYRHNAGQYAVLHDTGELYLVDAKDVESFMATYRKFLNGDKI